MVKVRVEKFSLIYNGNQYKAGSIVEMQAREAENLVNAAPKEFSIVSEALEELPKGIEGVDEIPEDGVDLSKMTIKELKAFAEEQEIDIGSAKTKDAIIEAITNTLIERAEDIEDTGDDTELPDINPETGIEK